MTLKYSYAVFISAFLIFQIQPIVAKYIQPWFGGASGVWAVCLVFFQVFLLIGYLYAHLLSKVSSLYKQALIHCVLVGIAVFAFLPIDPVTVISESVSVDPRLQIIILLITTVGLPYAVISSSGPLFQNWFRYEHPSVEPYRLYALSNVGSLLGLLSYPLIVEPFSTLTTQSWGWSIGFVLYFLICLMCLYTFRNFNQLTLKTNESEHLANTKPPTVSDLILWASLAATASMLLLATTNQITLDIASVPFLWILPLAAYLITFIICFEKPEWYKRGFWVALLLVSVVGAVIAIIKSSHASFAFQLASFTSLLFTGCMVCHGELFRKRPAPHYLTKYYLTISAGGATGGMFVALVAPTVFSGYWELQLVIVFLLVLVGMCMFSDTTIKSRILDLSSQVIWTLMCVAISFALLAHIQNRSKENLSQKRSFYGVSSVYDARFSNKKENIGRKLRILQNGTIVHGAQLFEKGEPIFAPTTYYGFDSGVGSAIDQHPKHKDRLLNVGVVGMGAANIATLCSQCRSLTFFEIDPNVVELEQKYFKNLATLRQKGVNVNVAVGDGRILLDRANKPYQFDVLVIDAFSGDAVPVHLLTYEALQIYWESMSNGGVLAIHVSNRHLNLTPVVVTAGKKMGVNVFRVDSPPVAEKAIYASTWLILTSNQEFSATLESELSCQKSSVTQIDQRLWTDQYNNILGIMKINDDTQVINTKTLRCY